MSIGQLARLDLGAAGLVARTAARVVLKPEAAPLAWMAVLQYQQIRYMLDKGDFWDPVLGSATFPFMENG